MINDFVVEIIDYFDINMFVETGTLIGETITTLDDWNYKKAIEVVDINVDYCRISTYVNILRHSKLFYFVHTGGTSYESFEAGRTSFEKIFKFIHNSFRGWIDSSDSSTLTAHLNLYELICAEENRWNFYELMDKAGFSPNNIPSNFKECTVYRNDSRLMIKEKTSKDYQDKNKNCLFYLDAHKLDDYPLLEELACINQMSDYNPIVVIDDFFVPGRSTIAGEGYTIPLPGGPAPSSSWPSHTGPGADYGYDVFGGDICGVDYIRDSIKNTTDTIFCCQEQNVHRRGCGVIFFNRNRKDLQDFLSKYPMIEVKI